MWRQLTIGTTKLSIGLTQRVHSWPFLPVFIFILALGIRLCYSYFFPVSYCGDSPGYQGLAHSISTGNYSTLAAAGAPGGFPADLQRPPGYPTVLWLVGGGQIVLFQCIVSSLVALLIYASVKRLTDERRIALLAALLYAVDLLSTGYVNLIAAETVFMAMVSLAYLTFALYLNSGSPTISLAAGMWLGLAALFKPVAQVLVAPFFLAWLLYRRRQLPGLCFLVSYSIVVVPWMIRNQVQHGVFTLSEVQVSMLYFYTAQGAATGFTGIRLERHIEDVNATWSRVDMDPQKRSFELRSASGRLLVHHWHTASRQAAEGLALTAFGPGRERLRYWELVGVSFVEICCTWGLLILAVVRCRLPAARFLGVVIMCLLVTAAAPNGYSRFRVPIVPAMCALAAIGLTIRPYTCFSRSGRSRTESPMAALYSRLGNQHRQNSVARRRS